MLHRAALVLLALLCAPAMADPVRLPQVTNAGNASVPSVGAVCVNPDGSACANGLPAAISTPVVGIVTASGVTNLSGAAATSANGTTLIGPWTSQAGRDVMVEIDGAGNPQGSAQLYTSPDGCATLNAITMGGQVSPLTSWPSLPVNESSADTGTTVAGRAYCVKVTVTSGSGTFRMGNN